MPATTIPSPLTQTLLACLLLAVMTTPTPADTDPPIDNAQLATATFAGGCFWCMEPPFDKLEGVVSTTSGYAGGDTRNPTYQEVCTGTTGHTEALQIRYDPAKVDYAKLLEVFWHNIDPTVKDRQFCDIGSQYRTAIFYHDDQQKQLAEQSKRELEASERFKGKTIATELAPATVFYRAEEYHQDFYKKSPDRYYSYRRGCGRDQRLEQLWGKDAAKSR